MIDNQNNFISRVFSYIFYVYFKKIYIEIIIELLRVNINIFIFFYHKYNLKFLFYRKYISLFQQICF